MKDFLYICNVQRHSALNIIVLIIQFNFMKRKEAKIEIWFDKISQSLFLFGDDKKSNSFLKKGGNDVINEMIEKIKDNLKSTNDEFPDYIRFLRNDDSTWTIESFFDENAGCDKDGKPSIVDFMSNIDEMEISFTDRGKLN